MNIDIFKYINKFLNTIKSLITKLQKKLNTSEMTKKGKVIPINKKGESIKRPSKYSKYFNLLWYAVGIIVIYYLFPVIVFLISLSLSIILILLMILIGRLFFIKNNSRR